jgi:hypothetical protein
MDWELTDIGHLFLTALGLKSEIEVSADLMSAKGSLPGL